ALCPANSDVGVPYTVVGPVLSYDRKPLPPGEGPIPAIDLPNASRQHPKKVAPVNAPHNSPRAGAERWTHRTGHPARCQRRNHQVTARLLDDLGDGQLEDVRGPDALQLGDEQVDHVPLDD